MFMASRRVWCTWAIPRVTTARWSHRTTSWFTERVGIIRLTLLRPLGSRRLTLTASAPPSVGVRWAAGGWDLASVWPLGRRAVPGGDRWEPGVGVMRLPPGAGAHMAAPPPSIPTATGGIRPTAQPTPPGLILTRATSAPE